MQHLFVIFALALAFSASAFAQAPPAASADSAYQIGPGDRLRITVFGEADLTGEYQVGADGMLAFPLIGEVGARDLTPEQLSGAIASRLREGYLREPRVATSVISYRPFYILGEVQNPGTYSYAPDLDVLSAVAVAGGFTYRANRSRVFIRHVGEEEERPYSMRDRVRVRPGDTVRVGERFF